LERPGLRDTSLGLRDASRLLRALGPPSETFEHAEKTVGARIVIGLSDGRRLVHESIIAPGCAGDDTRARHPELLRQKFLSTGGSPDVADAVADLEHAPVEEVAGLLSRALAPLG
jgi:hypothetical protein